MDLLCMLYLLTFVRSAMMFGKSWMGNALVVGRTANPLSGTPPLGLHQVFFSIGNKVIQFFYR